MIDQEVANILEQIKQGVRQSDDQPVKSPESLPPRLSTSASIEIEPERVVTLSNQYPGLATMSRAWDRLPPVVSNRTGALASLELWIKGILKRALRWITWEQINFNHAVHHSFMEVAAKQAGYEQELSRLQTRLANALETQQREQQEIMTKQRDALNELEVESARARAEIAVLRVSQIAMQAQVATLEEERRALLGEIRERDGRLLDEQRVCFKQLSLEASEALVEQNHTRREIEERLAKLEAEAPPSS